MNRTILTVAGVFGTSSLLLVDSAVKGAALLMLAAVAAMVLRRDSSATRHLVWMLAMVALLVVPMLSALLPQWRVLPEWAGISAEPVIVAINPPSIAEPTAGAVEWAQDANPVEVERPAATAHQSAAELPDSQPALMPPEFNSASEVRSWNWINALPLVWAIGFSVLILRLLAARWMLWNTERQGMGIKEARDPIITALENVCWQLRLRRPVTLLMHPDKTIPVVWGILRCRLLLPEVAREWSGEQLRSVLLHELAHIKRRDTWAQVLTQIACAVHWFDPLVWFAAWRLGVERERACDDLVLADGVRPSAYAGHLLDVVTALAPARWPQSCGLAMARKSSLEGRLTAVLSGGRNRRGVTRILAAGAVILAAAVAIPLAMLHATQRDQLKTETTTMKDEPKDAKSRPLFEDWKTSARTDGKIPGGRIGEMAASLKTFMGLNPGHEQSVKLGPVLKKCDAARDWTPAEAAALLDEIAAITPRAEWAMRTNTERKIHPGKPLPDELAKAPWGRPAENGLRIAWLLEPRAETEALDSVMKSRVLFHNAGKAPVCFATEDWIQTGGHKAKDANGKDISVWAVSRMGIRLRMNFRLAPGEYAEVAGHGLGVGSHATSSEQSIYNVGCWIEAKEGDAVTFTPGKVPVSFQTWKDNEGLKNSVTVWQEMIAQRVMQESPMPAAAADRELLLRRVMKDFPGTAPTAEEIAAFVADDAKDSLPRLIKSLQTRCQAMHFAGELSGGETKFRVTAAVPKKDQPKPGSKLKPTTEQKLKWGEPVNGLRMALAWPPSLGEPGMGDAQDFYLAVQNVAQVPIRLTANDAAPNPRRLIMWDNSRPMSATRDPSPMPGDWLLQPRDVAFLRLFRPVEKLSDGRTLSAAKEQAVRVYPQYSLTAEMSIEKAPAGAWTGKLATGETRGSRDVIAPKHKDAQALYKTWTTTSRADGKISGGVIGMLGESVKTFIKNNPTWETTPQLQKMLPRFDASRDWNAQDAVALLDELAALQTTPISMALDHEGQGIIRTGAPLPTELANAPWGEALPNGLRLAWLLEPRAAEYRLDTPLTSRILIHNSGKIDIVFRTGTWHQSGGHKARDAKGKEIDIESTEWTTLSRLTTFRLAPGEFVELAAAGIGIGKKNKNDEDWQNTRVGSWLDVKVGDDVTFIPDAVLLGDGKESTALGGEPRWWLDFISARLSRHLPFPADADGRLEVLHRVAIEVLGTSASRSMNNAFIADRKPDALDSVAKSLFHYPGLHAWAGPLTSGPTKFRVLPADPDAAKKPRTASNPGRYTLGDLVRLEVSRRPIGERIVNEATIHFYSRDPKADAPGKPVALKLPDGYNTWAAAWVRGATVLWVLQIGNVRSYDFTNPAQVKETTLEEPANLDKVPKPILDALRAAFDVPGTLKPAPALPKEAPASAGKR